MIEKLKPLLLSNFIKGSLIVVILFLSSALITSISDKYDIFGSPEMPDKVFFTGLSIFSFISIATFLLLWIAIKKKENEKVLLFSLAVIVALYIVGIVAGFYLVSKYVDAKVIIAIVLTNLAIALLLEYKPENKNIEDNQNKLNY
jgi:hypothetical protein